MTSVRVWGPKPWTLRNLKAKPLGKGGKGCKVEFFSGCRNPNALAYEVESPLMTKLLQATTPANLTTDPCHSRTVSARQYPENPWARSDL